MTGKISDPFYMPSNSTSQGSETFVRNRQATFFKEVWMTAGRTKYVPLHVLFLGFEVFTNYKKV
jgi:hypothetical protein